MFGVRMLAVGLVAVLASLALAGCSSDDDGGGDSTAAAASEAASTAEATAASSDGGELAIDPCTLVTKAEVETVLGGPVNDGVLSSLTPDFTSCEWEDSDGFPAAQIVVLVYPDDATASDTFAADIERNGYEEIPDLGERAYSSIVFDATILDGRIELSIDLVPQTDEQLNAGMQEPAIALARTALDRLP